MQESQHRSTIPARPGANGAAARREPVDPLDRSDLLRRHHRFPFDMGYELLDGIRLRRERRVSGSFSGIPRLARRSDR